jgi:hypothetical protein
VDLGRSRGRARSAQGRERRRRGAGGPHPPSGARCGARSRESVLRRLGVTTSARRPPLGAMGADRGPGCGLSCGGLPRRRRGGARAEASSRH